MRRNYNDVYTTSYRDRNHKKRNILICSIVILCVLVAVGIAVFIIREKHKDDPVQPTLSPACSDVPDEERLDCYPDAPVNEKECINRGCCYSAPKNGTYVIASGISKPYCYFPSNYVGYIIKEIRETSRRKQIKLQRAQRSGFIKDIPNVIVQISYIDDNSFRIKITDANSQRYEVPTQLYYQTKKLNNPLYNISVDSHTGFLTVVRTNTESIVFRTNLFRLIFSDQFLQLSSDLPSSNIYGIGEHYESVLRNVNWSRFTLINSDLSPKSNHGLYGSHPFHMVLEEDGKASGVFLFNSNIMDVILQPAPAITWRPIGGILDFFIMMGPGPNEVSQQYSSIVGKTFMPPFWSLGFHLCRYGYNSLNKTKETMERTIKAGIPLDVQWNDIDYMDQYKDFTYDEVNFAGLPEFVEELHSKGMHYVLMIDPGLSNAEKSYIPYEEGLDDDIFVKDANGSIFIGKVWTSGTTVYPDFSHPAATSYWTRQLRRLYDDIKYDGVWIDMNEPSNFNNGGIDGCPKSSLETPQYVPGGNLLVTKTLCMTAKHYYTTHYNEHNLYAYKEAVATNEAIRSIRKKRPFIISRASFAGQGVYSGHWSGDIFSSWEDMRYSVRSLINFNMYAMPMIGSDICGFNDNTTVELCARWQALGAFYPFSRNHNEKDTVEQDPVALGQIVVEATKIALQKRYTLLPTLYTLFYKSHVFGDTVIRPLFFEFPEDEKTYHIDEQFLWGSNLLIAQVLYPNTSSVDVYFPKGIWYNALDGQKNISSGEHIEITVPINDIHISIRGGTILLSQVPAMTTTETRKNPFILAAALDEQQKAFGELYWDDGDSLDTYENGYYNLIQFNASNGSVNSTVIHSGYSSDMILQTINIGGYEQFPSNVTVNGQQCNYTSNSSLVDNEDDVSNSTNVQSIGFAGFGVTKHVYAKEDPFCTFFPLGPFVMVETKNISLLSPLSVTWE